MKKVYITPITRIHKLRAECQILAGTEIRPEGSDMPSGTSCGCGEGCSCDPNDPYESCGCKLN